MGEEILIKSGLGGKYVYLHLGNAVTSSSPWYGYHDIQNRYPIFQNNVGRNMHHSQCIWHKNSKLLPESQPLSSMAGYEPFNVSKIMISVTKSLKRLIGLYDINVCK